MFKLHSTLENTFKDAVEIDDFTTKASNGFITVRREKVTFKMQSGDVPDFGLNGVQCEEMLIFVAGYIKTLNGPVPSKYNEKAILHIEKAISELDMRTEDRVYRGVEGTGNA